MLKGLRHSLNCLPVRLSTFLGKAPTRQASSTLTIVQKVLSAAQLVVFRIKFAIACVQEATSNVAHGYKITHGLEL